MPCVISAGASLLPLRFLSAAIIGWLSGGGQRQRAGLIALIILLSGCTARPPVLFRSPFWTRYAPFVSRETCDNEFWDCATAGDPSLFDRFGQLTEVGRAYQRAPQ